MKKLIFMLLVAIQASYAIEITEIMYNPEGNDNYYEYLELYSEQQSSLQGYYFEGVDLTFNESNIEGYFVVCKDKEMFIEMYNETCEEEYSGSLLNSGETITLYDSQGEKVNEVTYEDVANEGQSIIRETAWQPSSATPHQPPGTPDAENETVEINITINETQENVSVNVTINETNVSINITEENVTVNIALNDTLNETLVNITTINETVEEVFDIILTISTNKESYDNKEKMSIYFQLNEEVDNFIIEYRIEDLFGNIIKKPWNTTNLNTKHYTPSITERDKVMVIKAFVYVNEYDADTSNNFYEKNVFVKNKDYQETTQKEITTTTKSSGGGSSGGGSSYTAPKTEPQIKSFYTRTKLFEEGKEITLTGRVEEGVEAHIINGNISKKLTIEEGAFSYKTNLTGANPSYILEVFKNGEKIEEKELEFNITTTEEEINHLLSDEKQENSTESVINKKKSQMEEAHKIELYESDNEGAKKIVQYVMLGLSILFNVVLIWKR